MNSLHIGVSAWIIQDGNYPDFRVGDVVRTALEFHPHGLRESSAESSACMRLSGSNYRVTARTIFTDRNVFVLDFGLLAYDQAPPPKWMKPGRFVDADIYVGIDPFFYFEELHAIKGMPELRYQFRVTDVQPGFVDTQMAKAERRFWVASPEKAARQIAAAIRRRKQHVYVTRRWRLIAWLLRALPDALYSRL